MKKCLYYLSKQEFFGKGKLSKLELCENCVLVKQHRLSFNFSPNKAKSTLEYIHDDLWGPTKVQT